MANKHKIRILLVLSLILLVALTAMQSFAGDSESSALSLRQWEPGQHGPVVEKEAVEEDPLSPLAGERVWPINPAPLPLPPAVEFEQPDGGCPQLLVNTELDVITVGGSATAEPWVVLWPDVYYSDTTYTSPIHSLFLVIGDSGDPSPNYDGFGQAFQMPSNLTSVTAQYNRRIDFANGIDEVYGELWTVDDQGFLDDYITGWIVSDTPSGWGARMFTVSDGATLSQMSGRLMALVLVNDTTDTSPGEVAYFDDVTLTVCFDRPTMPATYRPPTIFPAPGRSATRLPNRRLIVGTAAAVWSRRELTATQTFHSWMTGTITTTPPPSPGLTPSISATCRMAQTGLPWFTTTPSRRQPVRPTAEPVTRPLPAAATRW
jgi:hypothetical protein